MRTRLSTFVSVVATAATLAAQQTSTPSPPATPPARDAEQPTFRTASNYVRVDMYAARDGQPVEDLRLEEVDVLEDGAPQTIEAFEHVKVRPAGPQESRVEPKGVNDSRQMAADPRARVFVI